MRKIFPFPCFLFPILFLFCFSSCVPPAYQNTTYGIEELILDSEALVQLPLLKEESSSPSFTSLKKDKERIGEGDALTFLLFCPKNLSLSQTVNSLQQGKSYTVSGGKIHLPMIASIQVENLTLKEAQQKIQTAYSKEIAGAQVYLDFKKRKEKKVQIIGGSVPFVHIHHQTLLSTVVALAQPSCNVNLTKSYVARKGEILPIDLNVLLQEGEETQNIFMEDGDQIFFAPLYAAHLIVTGEILTPTIIPLPHGFLSLKEALAKAHGILFTGNSGEITIIRGGIERPKIYSFSWKEVLQQPNKALLLTAGDIVYIPQTRIHQWNLFISQLLPSLYCCAEGCPRF